jgi:hypothetical protein
VRFFLDNCISPAMAKAIQELARSQRVEVTHLSERFDRDIPDVDWISTIGREGWVVVSGDTRISRNPIERAAWQEARFTAFFLDDNWASRSFWVQAAELIRWWPIIGATARTCKPGSGFRLPFKGTTPLPIYTP